MTNQNPLKKYFRQPTIYIRLPSEGKGYPQGALDMPPNNELPVYPMTAMDEITYRTADSLFNGSAVVNVISSCVPNIVDPWEMPGIDLDTVLVGIRIATYGHSIDIDSVCPSCNEENTFGVDLRQIMEQITVANYATPVVIGDISVYFKPLSYKQQNLNTLKQFEDQKILQAIPSADLPEEEKLKLINGALVKLGEMTSHAISQSIGFITIDNETVSDREHIDEFVKNCDRAIFNQLREKIIALKNESTLQPLNIACQHCSHQYEAPFTMDVSNFFASAS